MNDKVILLLIRPTQKNHTIGVFARLPEMSQNKLLKVSEAMHSPHTHTHPPARVRAHTHTHTPPTLKTKILKVCAFALKAPRLRDVRL